MFYFFEKVELSFIGSTFLKLIAFLAVHIIETNFIENQAKKCTLQWVPINMGIQWRYWNSLPPPGYLARNLSINLLFSLAG